MKGNGALQIIKIRNKENFYCKISPIFQTYKKDSKPFLKSPFKIGFVSENTVFLHYTKEDLEAVEGTVEVAWERFCDFQIL